MTTIVQTNPVAATLVKVVVETTLNGTADNFSFFRGTGQVLILRNPTGSTISNIKLIGSTATMIGIQGAEPKDVSTGFNVGSIAAGASKMIQLDSIWGYLQGVCSVTGGTGLIAVLVDAS